MKIDTKLDCKWFKKNLFNVLACDCEDVIQYVFRFKNGYGASVIKNKYSYGNEDNLWELAVIVFVNTRKWYLCYDSPITDDVEGYLSNRQVRALLKRIKRLPKVRD